MLPLFQIIIKQLYYIEYNVIRNVIHDIQQDFRALSLTFTTHLGIYAYDVMPFGLKNTGATYQQAIVTVFHDTHKEIEVYVDDMITKSRTAKDHLIDFRKLFKHLAKYRLRPNPKKCFFGAGSRKLLSFIVSQRGIEVDLAKFHAIRDMLVPKTEKQV